MVHIIVKSIINFEVNVKNNLHQCIHFYHSLCKWQYSSVKKLMRIVFFRNTANPDKPSILLMLADSHRTWATFIRVEHQAHDSTHTKIWSWCISYLSSPSTISNL